MAQFAVELLLSVELQFESSLRQFLLVHLLIVNSSIMRPEMVH